MRALALASMALVGTPRADEGFGATERRVGDELPVEVAFEDDGGIYRYAFRHVLPFRLAPGERLPDDPAAAFARLGDLHDLVLSHEQVLDAHRTRDVDRLLADQAAIGISVGAAGLALESLDSSKQRLGAWLASAHFDRYEDVVAPVVSVSDDGTRGWLACEISAGGRLEDGTPLEFGFAWVELFARREGRWLRTGNASSELRK